MSKTLARATAPLVALTLAWGLAACSSPTEDQESAPDSTRTAAADPALAAQEAALDTYVAASQDQIPAIMEAAGATYSEIRISAVQPDTVEYAYLFAESVDPAEAVAYFDENVSALQSVCDAQLFPEMNGLGITIDPKVRYVYFNADGSQLWAHEFSPS
jgi:hypothetical protein